MTISSIVPHGPTSCILQGVQARSKTVKMLLLQFRALHKFHTVEGGNTRDEITTDRKSRCTSPDFVLCIPFILSGSLHECWPLMCSAC